MHKAENFIKDTQAIDAFKKKFKDKTRNNWEARAKFVAYPNKYTMLEMGKLRDLNCALAKTK